MTVTGIFTSLILVFTAFIHIPSYSGYIHLGDTFIFLAASILPAPYAVFAGAAGAVLSDVLTGYAMWAPASLIIKAVTVFFFTWKGRRITEVRNLLGLIPSAILCVGGYFVYEGLIFGSFPAAVYSILGNVLQVVFSSILYVAAGFALDKAALKEKMHLFFVKRERL